MATLRPCSRAAVATRKATVTRSASSWPEVRLMTTLLSMAATLRARGGGDFARTGHSARWPAADGGRGARAHAELGHDVRHVAVHGVLAEHEPLGDLAVREPVGHEREHLVLARAELAAAV